jgi:sec-independent protein translocase protein TatA
MPSLGPAEILVILVVALLVFGPDKMPEIARQVGKGFREFRRMQQHLKSELRDVVSEFDSSSTPSAGGDPVPMLPPKDDPAAASAVEHSDSAPTSSAPALPAPDAPAAPPTSHEPDAPDDPA